MTQSISTPTILGEADIRPSSSCRCRYGSAFPDFVRGGNAADQNLVMPSTARFYNADHLLGIFSIFQPEERHLAELFPARYGGRISSIVDVR